MALGTKGKLPVMTQPRSPRGTPRGGQWSATRQPESGKSLDIDTSDHHDLTAAMVTSGDELWPYVCHPDPAVRCATVYNRNITAAQLDYHQRPDSPFVVRQAVVYTMWPDRWQAACRDASPLIRAKAADLYDIPPDVREHLLADPDVAAHRQVMVTAAPALAHGT